MEILEVTKENFENEVLKSPIPVLADFNADWCGPCRMLAPILESVSETMDDVKFVSVNIDDEAELAEEYDIVSIPCLIVFKDGEEADRSVGLVSADEIAELADV